MTDPRKVPDSCPDCNAVGTMTEARPGVFVLTIEHAERCPYFKARSEQRERGAR
jgi:hypothetical protein